MDYLWIIFALFAGALLGSLATFSILGSKLAKKESELEYLAKSREQDEQRIDFLEQRFTEAVRNMTNQALQASSVSLSEFNQTSLQNLLSPLKERIKEFQDKVEHTHKESLEKNASLVTRISLLESLGKQMSAEADKLTKALKGEVKTQGNWGELILERVLEESGLRNGVEYFTQGAGVEMRNEQGNRIRPDVVVQLPENKHIIIDSKVSLVAYERYVHAETTELQTAFGKDLVKSVKAHVDRLSSQHYQYSDGVKSPDFVLLFMPLEPCLGVALQNDPTLYSYAWERKVVIVTPTTLMATLWTIANIWRQEHQTANALDIAKRGGALYDKFVLFTDAFLEIGKTIDKTQEIYVRAYKQLATGRSNLISQAEKLREMGAAHTKEIDSTLTDQVQNL